MDREQSGFGKGHFTQEGDRWATIERSKIGPISQRFPKAMKKLFLCKCLGDPCALVVQTLSWRSIEIFDQPWRSLSISQANSLVTA